uniref:Secreted protein n=1 Tax=Leersia perrieri TaxID=77586 RepID=A0A0D9X4W5_9ORYZ
MAPSMNLLLLRLLLQLLLMNMRQKATSGHSLIRLSPYLNLLVIVENLAGSRSVLLVRRGPSREPGPPREGRGGDGGSHN